ncbi:hypothetical protein E1B28_008476 [Marasmius oreades]|uniref:Uncharacterized protein n=1 Tax=Marasmius oreades TaxID=181124 RepID=A0A9P7RYM0_9AGAR|nr:uncharacterized protein E1B28_008476 [Marasmius oreades]KAG7092100.1 hypothetical protein E1B28_008476 [Marasmius oreades]
MASFFARETEGSRELFTGPHFFQVSTDFDVEEGLEVLEKKRGMKEFAEMDGLDGGEDQASSVLSPPEDSEPPVAPPPSKSPLSLASSDQDLRATKRAKLSHELPEKSRSRHPKAEKRDRRKRMQQRPARNLARQEQQGASGLSCKQVAARKGIKAATENAVSTSLDAGQVRAAETGWTGVRRPRENKKTHTLQEAIDAGLQLFEWDGRSTHLLVTKKGVCLAVLAGTVSDDLKLQEELREAERQLNEAGSSIQFTRKEQNNDRGTSPAVARGVSHGGGQTEPKILSHSKKTKDALDQLVELPLFRRLSGQANHFLRFYAPRAYDFQAKGLEALVNHDARLKLNFKATAFAACTWNFGPQFVSFPHLDANNSAYTWCAITPMGDFDPKHGGHLILWDLGLVIQFPPGATVLIPSALLVHSNTCVREGETRHSFIQYSAGALFRWVSNGFQTKAKWEAQATEEMKCKRQEEDKERVKKGFEMFSTVQEIRERYKSMVGNS